MVQDFVITFWRIHIRSSTTTMSVLHFLIKIMFIVKAIKSRFFKSNEKQNHTLAVVLYGILKLAEGSVHKFRGLFV